MQYVTVYDENQNSYRMRAEDLASRVSGAEGQGLSRQGVRRVIKKKRCCPPSFAEIDGSSGTPVETNVDGDELVIFGCPLDGDAIRNVAIKAIPGTSTTPHPLATSFSYDPSREALTVNIDQNGAAASSYLLEIHKSCGCCQAFVFTQR